MPGRRIKFLLYGLVAAGVFTSFVLNYQLKEVDPNVVETTVLTMLERTAEEVKKEPADLALEKVTLKKVADPTSNFNYYKYQANVVIKNYGGKLKNAKVTLEAGKNQKHLFVKNSPEGFNLPKNQSYIFENYQVLFDGNYNAGKITFVIGLKDQEDYYLDNNKYEVEIFELPAKIESIGLNGVQLDGTFNLGFKTANQALVGDEFELFSNNSGDFEQAETKYDEIENKDNIYGYHRIKNSLKSIENINWQRKKVSFSEAGFIKFNDDAFKDSLVHYLYIRATNPENGNYAISNILRFSPQTQLSRADFAKLFVEYAQIPLQHDGGSFYEDVSPKEWFAPEVQTLFNLGLLSTASPLYFPEEMMSRGEVLRVLMDYFDVQLATNEGVARFSDIEQQDYLYPYLQALYASGKGSIFGEAFNPKFPATKNYLKYLVSEYQ